MQTAQSLFIPFVEFATLMQPNTQNTQIPPTQTQNETNICLSQKKVVPLHRKSKYQNPTMPKTTAINNRRYLGNKYKLLPFITAVVNENCHDIQVVADLFAGTGAVSSAFQDKTIITNDILYSNYISNLAWFSPQEYNEQTIRDIIIAYNQLHVDEENYMSENFADTFFSKEDCKKIGYIREDIETKFRNNEINERERALLITSLLYAMDKIAKT